MSPFLQHRWSSLEAPVAPSASQQRLLRPFWTPRQWLKWQILLMLTKENFATLVRHSNNSECSGESLLPLDAGQRQTLSQSPIPLGLSQENMRHFSFSSLLSTEDFILNFQWGNFFGDGKCRQLFFAKREKQSLERLIANTSLLSNFWALIFFFNKNLQMFHLFSSNVVQEANNAWIIAFGLISPSSCSRTWQFLGK